METITQAACKHPRTGKIGVGGMHYDAWAAVLDPAEFERATRFPAKLEGFMTSRGRFVSRRMARRIAIAAAQVRREDLMDPRNIGLFSEDF